MTIFSATSYNMRNFIRRNPALFFPAMRARQIIRQKAYPPLVKGDTEIVIEGFFRSANTFTVRAFLNAQPVKPKIADHTHAAATIVRAARLSVPTLLLIRQPADTITSLVLKQPNMTLRRGFKDYIAYYNAVWPYRDSFVVATFEEVTTDLGRVIARLNERFGTGFERFDHNAENVQAVWSRIEKTDSGQTGGDMLRFSVPKEERNKVKKELLEQLRVQVPDLIQTEAQEVYDQYAAEAQ